MDGIPGFSVARETCVMVVRIEVVDDRKMSKGFTLKYLSE
jgi:hypothetical protein